MQILDANGNMINDQRKGPLIDHAGAVVGQRTRKPSALQRNYKRGVNLDFRLAKTLSVGRPGMGNYNSDAHSKRLQPHATDSLPKRIGCPWGAPSALLRRIWTGFDLNIRESAVSDSPRRGDREHILRIPAVQRARTNVTVGQILELAPHWKLKGKIPRKGHQQRRCQLQRGHTVGVSRNLYQRNGQTVR